MAQDHTHRQFGGTGKGDWVAWLTAALVLGAPWSGQGAAVADPAAAARIVVTETVARPSSKVPPLGANAWGRCGAVEWAANNFVQNSGNEPVYWRNLHRVKDCGPNWFEIDGPGTSWWDLWASGFLSGAEMRLYRLVDKDGQSLPQRPDGNALDTARADHVVLVGKGQIIPEGEAGFPDGGWVANVYADAYPNAWVRHGNLTATDASGLANGRTYWYVVVAVNGENQESAVSNEVSALPAAGLDTPPHLLVCTPDDKVPELKAGAGFRLAPKLAGGAAPFTWAVVDTHGQPASLPAGLALDAATGAVAGTPQAAPDEFWLRLQVTDARGRRDVRAWRSGAAPSPGAAGKDRPLPPSDVQAVAGDGCVTLTWKASPSPNVVAYRLKRSTAPAAEQVRRVYVTDQTPRLEKWDYVVLQRRFGNFDMRYVNSRVRGIGNPMDAPGWYWNGDLSQLAFTLVPHPRPLPADLVDPGETCLQVRAGAGEQSLDQFVFIGTQRGRESLWYGQLEPGRRYRLEVWLRQEGLANHGTVTFSFGRGYPDIRQDFQVDGEWRRYTHEFDAPERPAETWHFGQRFTFTGPGVLWLDNCRLFRVDQPGDRDALYVPNATVLAELLRSQPEAGPKGAHRIWFLDRDATMSSILSWHANASVRPDWRTAVRGTLAMTLPMGLEFDLRTGPDPQSRMRPWLVLQHILHSEEDWLALVEYLAAPYDPARDTPAAKPWAYRRYQQRGDGTPWTAEFSTITIEFGNETWHNGVFDDWLGFATRNAVHQGGREYGLFTRYLVEVMRRSPYWQACDLDRKIRFALGANYDGRVNPDGSVRGYGEEAMQTNPYATVLGHANYVGPKWETGDYSARNYDEHGLQECLLSFLTGPQAGQMRMGQARAALAASHHAYDLAAYEGGPGGYALPGRAEPAQVETNEKYGKSLAQGIGALDAWLGSYLCGWTDQCFLGYGQGSHWNSHTVFADGFRPSPAWQALALRNRYASGDLMTVEAVAVPTIARGKDTWPLVGTYALRDGRRWSVFVISRKLDGRHDDADFGDGFSAVAVRLPFAQAASIVVHTLTGDPRETNRERLAIDLQSRPVPASALRGGVLTINAETGGGAGGLPPGSAFLYVIEAAGR